MSIWYAKAAALLATLAVIIIRAPHGHRSGRVKVVRRDRPTSERLFLPLAMLGFFLTLVWVVATPLQFASYPLLPGMFAVGLACYVVGLWLFHRSHVDLGTNWSVTLEVREQHTLVTGGCYRRIRHPMYTALLLYSAGQALVIPNWIVGPSYLVILGALIALRLPHEERMMTDQFGDAYRSYAARTQRLIPGVW